MKGLPQAKSQSPMTQVGEPLAGAMQASPHRPQCSVLLWTFTHEPAQLVVPPGQSS
jgi:hypothetical protein